jgi:hypothetical protein
MRTWAAPPQSGATENELAKGESDRSYRIEHFDETIWGRKYKAERTQLEQWHASARERSSRSIDFALFALRSCFLLNSGAIAAVVTIAAGPGADSIGITFDQLQAALNWFISGCVATVLAASAFYAGTHLQGYSARRMATHFFHRMTATHPVDDTKPATRIPSLSHVVRGTAVLLLFIAVWDFGHGLTHVSAALYRRHPRLPPVQRQEWMQVVPGETGNWQGEHSDEDGTPIGWHTRSAKQFYVPPSELQNTHARQEYVAPSRNLHVERNRSSLP